MHSDVAVELKSVTKRFGETVAINNVSLHISRGETFVVLGPSGAGKSTLMRLISGVDMLDEGTIILDGRNVTKLPSYKRNINTIFQNLLLFPHMTVSENVGYGLKMKGMPRFQIEAEVYSMLEFIGLKHLASRKPNNLSGGEQQRVAIARALINKALVLICDEPLTALDPALRSQIQSELKRVKDVFRVTLIYVTHNHEEALGMADRVAIINKGKVVQVDTPSGIYECPRSRFVAEFVGEINKFEGEMEAGACSIITKEGDRICLDPLEFNHWPEHPEFWMLRPEKVFVLGRSPRERPSSNDLLGTVCERTFTGPTIKYKIRLGSGKVIAAELGNMKEKFSVGDPVIVYFNSADLIPLESQEDGDA